MSYVNLNMLLATIPVYKSEKKKKDKDPESVDGVSDEENIIDFVG